MDIINILKNKNIKITKGREVVLEIFFEKADSLSADQIFMECRNRGKNINLSTVYRTIEIFCEKHIIDKFILEDGVSVYKIHKHNHNHRIECDICHKEIELECPIKKIEEMIKKETGFRVTDHSLKMNGICENCEKESQK